jgi:hypothetical protein
LNPFRQIHSPHQTGGGGLLLTIMTMQLLRINYTRHLQQSLL